MGLFSNNKKLCPICGSPTPRLLATKIEGQPICKECDSQIDLPDGAVNRMSLSDFRQYLAAFAENKSLQSEFQSSYQFHIGFWSGTLYVDEAHGLLRVKEGSGWVFEGKDLKSFRISEDGETLFESGDGAPAICTAPVLKRLRRCRSSVLRSYWTTPIGRKSRTSSPARNLTGTTPVRRTI